MSILHKPCRVCGSPILLVREVDSGRTLVVNEHAIEGGTVVLLGDQGQVVPPGPGIALSLHSCREAS